MAGFATTHLHLPKMVDVQDSIASFWREEPASVAGPRKHTMQPIVTGTSAGYQVQGRRRDRC